MMDIMDTNDKKSKNAASEQPRIDVTVEAPRTNQPTAPVDADTAPDNLNTVWDNPLFLPAGSVRSLLALLFAGVAAHSVVVGIDLQEPMMNLLFVIIGFYFGNKLK
jgi:hypothetical protein